MRKCENANCKSLPAFRMPSRTRSQTRNRRRSRVSSRSRGRKSKAGENEVRSVENSLREEIKSLRDQIRALRGKPIKKYNQGNAHGHGGAPVDPRSYIARGALDLAWSRAGWLLTFMGGLSVTAVVMSSFEHVLQSNIQLAYFVPLLIGHGGNAGGQSVGAIISGFSSGAISRQDWPTIVGKECRCGFTTGMLLAAALLPAMMLLGVDIPVAATIATTMPLLTLLSSLLGSCIPFFVLWCSLDPVRHPFITRPFDFFGPIQIFSARSQCHCVGTYTPLTLTLLTGCSSGPECHNGN